MKSRLVLVSFLLVLYIGPSLFALSYAPLAIPTEPNMTKDFSLSTVISDGLYLATDGEGIPTPTGDYTDTHVKDESSMFNLDASDPFEASITLEFVLPFLNIESVYLSFYGYTFTGDLSATTKELLVYNGTHWNDFGDIAEDSFGWTNITLGSDYVLTPFNTVYMKAHVVDDSTPTLLIDYAEIQFSYTDADWYSDSWLYRKSISIDGSVGAETNYQMRIPVTYDSDMQADFDDILYTAADGITLLDHWRETYVASTSAVFWVEVLDDLDNDQGIYMYYGNSTVSSASDGEATFLLFDDFEDNNLDNWADTTNMQISSDRTRDTYSASWISSGSNGFLQDNVYAGLSGIRLSFWNNIEISERGSFVYVYSETDYSENVATVRATYELDTSPIYYRDTGVYVSWPSSADDLNDDEWDRIEFAVDFNANEMQTWQNGVANGILAIVEDDGSVLETEEIDGIGLMMQSDKQIWFDDVIVRKWVVSEPEIDSWGEKEYRFPPPEWVEVGEAELIFSVPVDETGLNLLLIFLGLCMIPFSTLYLVRGGKSGMSSDKLFYGLIAFVMGWALFLGGIYG